MRAIIASMKKADVIAYFGSISNVADALKLSFQAVHQWPETVPLLRAYQIERLTLGKLKHQKIENFPMKTTQRTKTVYIAIDGKEFENQSDCIGYEARIERQEIRSEFAEQRTKTERAKKRLENLLADYDVCCAYESASARVFEAPPTEFVE